MGVSYCAVCDGAFFQGAHLAVVGGGDAAVEEAVFLTRFASRVTLIHRRGELRAQPILAEEARRNPKIDFILDTVVEAIEGDRKVKSLRLRNVVSGEVSSLEVGGVFIFVGFLPNTGLVDTHVDHDPAGLLPHRPADHGDERARHLRGRRRAQPAHPPGDHGGGRRHHRDHRRHQVGRGARPPAAGGRRRSAVTGPPSPSGPVSSIATRRGDGGETGLLYGGRVPKDDLHTEACGAVDEAVSALGLARAQETDPARAERLLALQRELFTVGAELATGVGEREHLERHFATVTAAMVEGLDAQLAELEARIPLPRAFVIPGGTVVAATSTWPGPWCAGPSAGRSACSAPGRWRTPRSSAISTG